MRILSRYVLGQYLGWFIGSLSVLALIASAADLLLNLDDVRELQEGLAGVFGYMALRLPALYLEFLIPLAAFGAALVTLGNQSLSLEILAAKAGGISPLRIALPVLGASLVLSACALLVNETVVVEAARAMKRAERGGGETLSYRRGSFWYHGGHSVYNIRGSDPNRELLLGVSVYERDAKGRLIRSIHAPSARLEGSDQLRFFGATVRTFDPENAQDVPRFEVLSEVMLPLGDPSLRAIEADPAGLSLQQLRAYLEAREREGEPLGPVQLLLHQRLASPLAVLVFALFATPLAMRADVTRSLAVPALRGVGLLLTFWLANAVGSTLAAESMLPPRIAPWLPVVAFSLFGTALLWNTVRS